MKRLAVVAEKVDGILSEDKTAGNLQKDTQNLLAVSSGTWAGILGLKHYKAIDRFIQELIAAMPELHKRFGESEDIWQYVIWFLQSKVGIRVDRDGQGRLELDFAGKNRLKARYGEGIPVTTQATDELEEPYKGHRAKDWRQLRKALIPVADFLKTEVPSHPLRAVPVEDVLETWKDFKTTGDMNKEDVKAEWDFLIQSSTPGNNVFPIYPIEWV